LVLGVLLVLVSVVAGARVFATADRYSEVYVARAALVPGEQVHAGDLTVGRVRFAGQGAAYVAAGREPVGYVVTRYVAAGELIPAAALTDRATPSTQSRLVTVPVAAGHLPEDLEHGDVVDVYVTAKSAGGARAPSKVLSAAPVDTVGDGSGSLSGSIGVAVGLVAPPADVVALVAAVEGGTIDLVRVPAGPVGRR
jgi:hypothetical protein